MESVVKNHYECAMKLLKQNKFARHSQSIIKLSTMQKLDKTAFNRYYLSTTEILVESIPDNLMKFKMSIKCSRFKRCWSICLYSSKPSSCKHVIRLRSYHMIRFFQYSSHCNQDTLSNKLHLIFGVWE